MTMSFALDSQKFVVVEVKSDFFAVENGKPFPILIEIKPVEGIHLNAKPPISVRSLTNDLTIKIEKVPTVGEWLDTSRPIKVEGNVTSMNPGRHEVDFILSYTYCSEKEKWCRFGNDTISIGLKLKK